MDQHMSVLDGAIRSHLNLSAGGFEYSGVREAETAALGKYLQAEFVHPATHRKVTISYFPEPTDPRAKETLCVHVTRDATNPYSGTFIIDRFLDHKGCEPAALHALDLVAHPGSPAERVRGVLLEVAKIFETDLRDVVAGRHWVDVPFDWGDYK
jgi:hypothetical protein